MSREYPTTVAGPYPSPPTSFVDREGREVTIERYDDEFDAIVEMYVSFHPEDRAQGIPPTGEAAVREWLADLLVDECLNLVAWHGSDAVGHAMLVPDTEDAFELAIFVVRAYQRAGIGTQLIESLLGAGREAGIDHIWLTVERWNEPAISLYHKVGFEPSDDSGFELEMAARLTDGDVD